MVEKKTVTYASISSVLAVLVFLGGMTADDLMDSGGYYCDARNLVMPDCDKLTKYYGLDNGKCWSEEHGNKLCRTGWVWINSTEEVDNPDYRCVDLVE